MIVYKENQKFYLSHWEYNACRIISALAEIVREHGGNVQPHIPCEIIDRTKYNKRDELAEKIEHLEFELSVRTFNDDEEEEKYRSIVEKLLKSARMEMRKLEDEINYDKPIPVTHTSYITFEMDGVYYYYQVDDNPFFEFHYLKTPITEKGYSRDACLEEDEKEWLYDCYILTECTSEEVIKAANFLFNMLVNADNSHIRRESKRVRVPNTYDSGWHYENVYEKERFGVIDW